MTAESKRTREAIRKSIQRMLHEHAAMPFHNLREADQQAFLWMLLRESLGETIPAEIRAEKKGTKNRHVGSFLTSRVHLEMKVKLRELQEKQPVSDVIVLRSDRTPVLTCGHYGPTDIIAVIEAEDVEAVIEIKAAPSKYPSNPDSFSKDVRKLHELLRNCPNIQAYFVLVDKSVSVAGDGCEEDLNHRCDEKWRALLRAAGFEHSDTEPRNKKFVEVWDLDEKCSPRCGFWHVKIC